ncbi:Calx-beta domain protein [Novipirellula aureliae]|uniref:Calx-beta domain protein n=1 Tax=Novipirellula aureliae TaxID=2527966 RepID=A0A5C6EBR9_9BACT|nr:Calx-beta domain-containing protein [Novipirellula aureliae]TWU45387.1 Calx-beta domain protein [Novipirellula aureliae]
MRHLRQLLGRSGWPQAEKRRNPNKNHGGRKRRLQSEALERRELLAGDVLASSYHNASMPTDVNQDSQITPLDALMVINYLSDKSGAEGEQITGFVDVNGDGEITPSDALMVINELSRLGEGAGEPVIELQLNPKSPTGVGSSNSNLPDVDNDRTFDVSVGQVFELEVSYLDLRSADAEQGETPDRRGVFQLVTDILASQGNNVVPIVHEAQQILIGQTIGDTPASGTLSLEVTLTDENGATIPTLDDSGNPVIDPVTQTAVPLKATIAADAFVADPVAALRTAMESLSNPTVGNYFPVDSFDVAQLDEVNAVSGVEGDYFLQVRSKGDDLIGEDIPNVTVNPVLTIPGVGTFPSNTVKKFSRQFSTTNVIPFPPATPDYALDFSSTNRNGSDFFANSGEQGTFEPDGDDVLFNELRGLGGTSIVPVSQLSGPFDSYSIPVFISGEVTGLDFSITPGQDSEAVLVYGFLDPGSSQGGLVAASTTFGTTTEINVVAAQVGEAFNEVTIAFNSNGPTNAAPTAAYDDVAKVITVTYDSGATDVTNRSYTAIANAINGLADFNASVSDGDGAAAFVEPETTPELAGGGEPRSIVPLDRITLDADSSFKINALPVGGTTPVPGTLGFQAATAEVDEDGGTVTLTVNRTGGSDGEVTINYSATNETAISGTDYSLDPGTLTFADGVTSQTITINIIDDATVEDSETFTVTLSAPGGGASLGTAVSTVTINDDDTVVVQPGTIALAAATVSVNEGAGNASFVINRTGGSDGTVTVTYATSDGTADASDDYTAVNTTVTFLDGETTKTVTVPILEDTDVEGDENFILTLSSPTGGATLGATTSSTATIVDNDEVDPQPGSFTITPVAVTVGEAVGSQQFTVTRSGGSDGSVTVAYATANGTAVMGSDYTETSGTLTFADGETTKTFNVPVIDDDAVENSEDFTVTLSNPTGGATLGTTVTSTVTITDNDSTQPQPGELSLSQPTVSVGEGDGSVTFTINRSGGSDGTVTVDYTTANGTATAGSDYTTNSGTLTFEEGETSKQVVVAILEDTADESNETFTLTLSAPTGGATLGSTTTSTATIVDNDDPVVPQPGVISISPATKSVDESGSSISFTVTRTGGSDGAVSVSYATSNGSATAGTDYTAASGTVNFADGEVSKTITVDILEDTIDEPNETFLITLTGPTGGAILGTVQVATATIIDNDEAPIGSSTITGSVFIDSVDNMDEVSQGYPNVTPERDGLKGADEVGLSGVKVDLVDSSGQVIMSVRTGMDGEYALTGVPQGAYTLHFGVMGQGNPGHNVFLSASGSNIVPVTVGNTSGTVHSDLPVLGRAGSLASVDILASSYLRNNPEMIVASEGGRRGGSVSLDPSTGEQIFFMAAEGFDTVEYAEVTLNSSRDQAILAIVENGHVLSAVLTEEEFVISRDGTALQFFGGYDERDDFGFAPDSGMDRLSSDEIAEILSRAASAM